MFSPVKSGGSTVIADQFVTHHLESTLVLKACGFIEAQRARILDVSDGQLDLRIGAGWLTRWIFSAQHPALDLRLRFRSFTESQELNSDRYLRPADSYCGVDVEIRQSSLGWTDSEFEAVARRILWALRSHFMSC